MKIINKNIQREYEILEKYEAGIALIGAEVKSVRAGNIKLSASYVKIINSELFLIGAEIPIYKYARPENYDSSRSRKLLLKKKEILRLQTKMKSSSRLTVVPVSCYNKRSLIKLEIALARGRKTWERKRVEKDRDEKRRVNKELKEYTKNIQ